MTLHYRTQGFVLKRKDFGEADRFYWIFTKDFGMLEILAKGIRKIKAKLKSPMELFNLIEVEFIQGKAQKTLTDALVIESFSNLKKDLKRLKISFKIAEIFDKLLKGEERDERIWQLLKEVFDKLNELEIKNWKLEILYYYFLWNFLNLLGYQPQIQKCLICQRNRSKLFSPIYFSTEEGGIICKNCSKKIKNKKPLTIESLKLLKLIFQNNWQTLKRLRIGKKEIDNLRKISENYLAFIQHRL